MCYNPYMKKAEHNYKKKSLEYAKALRKQMTPFEEQLWYYLRAKRFLGLKFKRQAPIGNFIVDFVCKEKKIVIELDGSGHLNKEKYDSNRDDYLRSLGYSVIRIYNNELVNIESVLEYLRTNIDPSL